jgi:coenzyme F420-reducing hydrogenase gamma subunit
MGRPTVGIFGLTGCAGDQLALLNCVDELLALIDRLDVRDFLMAASGNDVEARLDVALVEGAVLSRRDEDTLRAIRARSGVLVALGTCAMHGGIPVMDRGRDRAALLRAVYGERGLAYDALPARALHEVVPVDLAVPGCPVEKGELLAALGHVLRGDPPLPRDQPVCVECRIRENGCLLDRPSGFCLGPLTPGGCDARCPSLGIGCVGCRGPLADANHASALALYEERGIGRSVAARRMHTFSPAPPEAHAP